jgi:citronellol/citronellal dehydrogenase
LQTLLITGGSRGIGLAIGLRAARDGANVAILAKTVEENPKLPGTIHSAAAEIENAGGKALAIQCDIRFEDQIEAAVAATVDKFGGIDICVNNASAISLTPLDKQDLKRADLMWQINTRGALATTKACLPYLRKAQNPHVLMLSPPLDMNPRWFAGNVAYSIAKYGMSLAVLGLSAELASDGIAVNALWPRTTIATSAVNNLLGGDMVMRMSRTPDILADAAHLIFTQPSREFTGRFVIDDTFLHEAGGITDFERYRVDKTMELAPDFFVPAGIPPPPGIVVAKRGLR